MRDAPGLLLGAAKRLEHIDVPLSRATYLNALGAAVTSSDPVRASLDEVAKAAKMAPAPPGADDRDLLLDGLALVTTDGMTVAAPVLRRALEALGAGTLPTSIARWPHRLRSTAASLLWDYDGLHRWAERLVEALRAEGALAILPSDLSALAGAKIYGGDLSAVASLIAEAHAVIEASGTTFAPYAAAQLAGVESRGVAHSASHRGS